MTAFPAADAGLLTCPNPACGRTNPPGTRFCPSCGTAQPATAATPTPPPSGFDPVPGPTPPPPPRPPYPPAQFGADFLRQAGGLSASGGLVQRFEVGQDASGTYNRLAALLARGAFEPLDASPPSRLRAVHRYKHWTTIGLGLRYVCDFQITGMAGNRSVVDLRIDLEEGILMRYLLTSIGAIVVGGVLSGGIFLILGLIGLPIDYQNVRKKIPQKIADKLAAELGSVPKTFGAAPVP